jgi:hypothetical protein
MLLYEQQQQQGSGRPAGTPGTGNAATSSGRGTTGAGNGAAGVVDQNRQGYASYVRGNPETHLPRVVGCYRLEHAGLRLSEYFLVYVRVRVSRACVCVRACVTCVCRVRMSRAVRR